MARLTEDEKRELLRIADAGPIGGDTGVAEEREPPRRLLTPLEYAEIATFASRFDRSVKPVRFDGEHWKL